MEKRYQCQPVCGPTVTTFSALIDYCFFIFIKAQVPMVTRLQRIGATIKTGFS